MGTTQNRRERSASRGRDRGRDRSQKEAQEERALKQQRWKDKVCVGCGSAEHWSKDCTVNPPPPHQGWALWPSACAGPLY
jgi:hypothetical protein